MWGAQGMQSSGWGRAQEADRGNGGPASMFPAGSTTLPTGRSNGAPPAIELAVRGSLVAVVGRRRELGGGVRSSAVRSLGACLRRLLAGLAAVCGESGRLGLRAEQGSKGQLAKGAASRVLA